MLLQFLFDIDSVLTIDINECDTSNGGCNQTCDNTIGSFKCGCYPGYEMNDDGLICKGRLIHSVL